MSRIASAVAVLGAAMFCVSSMYVLYVALRELFAISSTLGALGVGALGLLLVHLAFFVDIELAK